MTKLILTAFVDINEEIVANELASKHISKQDISSVNLNANINKISNNSFRDFINLSAVFDIKNAKIIEDRAFENTALTGNLTLNKQTTHIGKYAFKNVQNITRAIVDRATYIGDGAFENCTALTSTNINPLLLSNLQNAIFKNCQNLNIVYGDLSQLSSFGDSVFENCPITKNVNTNLTLNKVTKYIGKYAFKGTQFTRAIVDRATYIGDGAFENCTALTSTNINGSNKIQLNSNTFKNCNNLSAIYNSQNISSIGDYAFASCYNFPEKISLTACTEIGRYAFLSCQNLSNLNAQQCTFVDYNAFYGTKLWDVDPQQ